jgi:4-hydroxybenzoyl-CoA thioesterase
MTRRHTTRFTVEFGDCDPAQIVFYPNFLRWIDSAARHYFAAAGLPSWAEMEATTGIIGTPLVEVSARFLRPATYGEEITVESWIDEWRAKRFVMKHVVRRGDDVLVEGEEIRVFARRMRADPKRIEAVDPPEDIRRLLG